MPRFFSICASIVDPVSSELLADWAESVASQDRQLKWQGKRLEFDLPRRYRPKRGPWGASLGGGFWLGRVCRATENSRRPFAWRGILTNLPRVFP